MRMWWWMLVAGCVASSDPADSADGTGEDAGPLRVVLMADTHVIGPQYVCCSESDGVDNDSIMRTPERLSQTIARINAIQPRPDHVFVLGDVLHDAFHSDDPQWYDANESAFSVAADRFAELEVPVHFLWGNHDYEVGCGGGPGTYSRELAHTLFDRFFQAPPYTSVQAGGWNFALLNSQLGPTWDPDHPKCETRLGSFGEEQLAWLDDLLGEGLPTVVMSHHHRLASLASDENEGANADLTAVLERHDNAAVHFAGHLHRWYDLEPAGTSPIRHIILGSTRYDDDNFWLVEFERDGTWTVLDYAKPQWFTTCANTWSYDGEVVPVAGAAEQGDCSL